MESKSMEGTARKTHKRSSGGSTAQQELFFHDGFGPNGEIPDRLLMDLDIRDPDTVTELCNHHPEIREEFALKALRIGVLALRQAKGVIDGDAVRKESDRLLNSMQERMSQHAEAVHTRLNDVLKDYFDPQSGRFQERLDRLVKRDGELEEVLRRQVGQEDSELRRTLVAHLGDESQLMKLLSPDEGRGILSALRETLQTQLKSQRDHVLNQFSLDNRDGALSRFISELTDRQGELSDKLEQRLDDVVREFSLDDESSALSRLVQNVDRAQKTITNEFSLDQEASALSRLKQLLEKTNSAIHQQLSLDDDDSPLARLKREMFKLLEDQNTASREFQQEVRVVLETMKARREEADHSTRHGLHFQDAVEHFIEVESARVGDIATPTGSTTGLIRNSKVGDCVIELGPESAAPGAKIVIEAKEDQSYTLQKARQEIEVGRNNRDAQVGVFVFSAKSAADSFEPLARYGDDIVIVWDPENAATDIFLKAAISLARALCVRRSRLDEATSADFTEIDRAILEIEKRSNSLSDIETWTSTIRSNADKVLKRVETSRKSFTRQVEVLREKTAEMKQLFGTND